MIDPHEPPQPLAELALAVLEWDRLLDLLAAGAQSPMGGQRCRGLRLEADIEGARVRLRETAEMVCLEEGTDPLPSLAFPDTRAAVSRAIKGAVLETSELRDVSIVIGAAVEIARALGRQAEIAPSLAAITAPLGDLESLRTVRAGIDRSIDAEGNVQEGATPELRRLVHEARSLKETMRRRLERILASERYADVLQESYFAERESRYVIPVKAELRSRVPGIVHDVSSSGATVFLEPRELVELNNAIKVAELAVAREIRRILQELSGEVAAHSQSLLAAMEALAEIDCIAAKARLSRLIGGRQVVLEEGGGIALKQARHPLLVVSREQVVANDIVMGEGVRVLVISGPNTGGKTVTLKIVGLFALMVRSGIPPSCGPDSRMGFFEAVYADIGDAQDLTRDLSSFSAHMMRIIRILAEAVEDGGRVGGSGDPRHRPLVLLDEIATSTDPAEGAALAEALLAKLASLDAKVVVTTHYGSLKALAQTTPGFMNASVEFDVKTLSPTYRLVLGLPGGSSAIEIARRLGMDEGILGDALGLVGREDRLLDRTMEELRAKRREIDEEAEQIGRLGAETERAAREAAEIAGRLAASEREERRRARARLADEVARARAEIRETVEALKAKPSAAAAREAKARLAEIDRSGRAALAEPCAAATSAQDRSGSLEEGGRVHVVDLDVSGTLLEAPEGKKRVRVRVGEAEISVPVSGLRARSTAAPGEEEKARLGWPRGSVGRALASSSRPDAPELSRVVDVRGTTGDEALEMTVRALDRASLDEVPIVRIIHGHGTGRLKAVVRGYLADSPYVAAWRPGDRDEGGDGATIVELK